MLAVAGHAQNCTHRRGWAIATWHGLALQAQTGAGQLNLQVLLVGDAWWHCETLGQARAA